MIRCIQCDNPAFKHPKTGNVYHLCAICSLKAICRLLGWKYDENTDIITADKRVGDILTGE